MVRPVVESRVSTVNVYFPGGAPQVWYDIEDWRPYHGNGAASIPVTMDKASKIYFFNEINLKKFLQVPVYYRGGSIIPRKDRPRRAASLMHDDPYTLYVVLDGNVRILLLAVNPSLYLYILEFC